MFGGRGDLTRPQPRSQQVYFAITRYYLLVSRAGHFLVCSITSTSDYACAVCLCWGLVYWKGEEQQHYNKECGKGQIPTGKNMHSMFLDKEIHRLQAQSNAKDNLKLVFSPRISENNFIIQLLEWQRKTVETFSKGESELILRDQHSPAWLVCSSVFLQ